MLYFEAEYWLNKCINSMGVPSRTLKVQWHEMVFWFPEDVHNFCNKSSRNREVKSVLGPNSNPNNYGHWLQKYVSQFSFQYKTQLSTSGAIPVSLSKSK